MNGKQKILVMIMFVCSVMALVGQSGEGIGGGVNSLSVSFDANTGRLSRDTDGGPFAGNAFDYGLEGTHSLGAFPWLSLYGKVALQSSIQVNNENLRNTYPNPGVDRPAAAFPVYMMNGVSGASLGFNYVEGGARFGGWGSVGVRHNLLLKGEFRIPLTLSLLASEKEPTFAINASGMKLALAPQSGDQKPVNIAVALYGGINAVPYRIGKWWAVPPGSLVGEDAEGTEGAATSPSIQDLYMGLSLSTSFDWTDILVLEDCGITLDASWRTNGSTVVNNNNAGYRPWKIDTLEAIKQNGKLRAQATISYAPTSALSSYVRFRYEFSNILPLPQGTSSLRDRQLHDYYVMAGVSYKFGGTK